MEIPTEIRKRKPFIKTIAGGLLYYSSVYQHPHILLYMKNKIDEFELMYRMRAEEVDKPDWIDNFRRSELPQKADILTEFEQLDLEEKKHIRLYDWQKHKIVKQAELDYSKHLADFREQVYEKLKILLECLHIFNAVGDEKRLRFVIEIHRNYRLWIKAIAKELMWLPMPYIDFPNKIELKYGCVLKSKLSVGAI